MHRCCNSEKTFSNQTLCKLHTITATTTRSALRKNILVGYGDAPRLQSEMRDGNSVLGMSAHPHIHGA